MHQTNLIWTTIKTTTEKQHVWMMDDDWNMMKYTDTQKRPLFSWNKCNEYLGSASFEIKESNKCDLKFDLYNTKMERSKWDWFFRKINHLTINTF